MTRYLITGAGGFVGRHFLEHLDAREEPVEVLGLDRRMEPGLFQPTRCRCRMQSIDLTDRELFEEVLLDFAPDHVVHLAAISSVAESWRNPTACIRTNVCMLLNLFEAVRAYINRPDAAACRVLAVGSSEVYGSADTDSLPLREDRPIRAENPYAVSRVTQEHLAHLYVTGFGLDIVSTRSFMHIGPGQSDRFAVASFLRQMLDARRRGETSTVLHTGNVDLLRDISDVRDVIRAYDLLLARGGTGEVYNVCRGTGITLREVIELAATLLELEVAIQVDPEKLRPNDPGIVVGSNRKLWERTDWSPTLSLMQTLRDMIDAVNTR